MTSNNERDMIMTDYYIYDILSEEKIELLTKYGTH